MLLYIHTHIYHIYIYIYFLYALLPLILYRFLFSSLLHKIYIYIYVLYILLSSPLYCIYFLPRPHLHILLSSHCHWSHMVILIVHIYRSVLHLEKEYIYDTYNTAKYI